MLIGMPSVLSTWARLRRVQARLRLIVALVANCLICGSTAEAARAPQAEVHLIGDAAQALQLEVVLRSLLVQQGLEPAFVVSPEVSLKEVLRPPASASGLVARIFVDLREMGALSIYISNGRAQSFVFREITIDPDKNELAREAAGAVVDSAVRILINGGTLELSRERAAETLRAGVVPEVDARRTRDRERRRDIEESPPKPLLRPAAFYGASLLGAGAGSICHGPGLGLEVLPEARLRSVLLIQYQLPVSFDGPLVGARIWTLATRAGGAFTLLRSARSRVSVSVLAGLDAIWLAPRALEPGLANAGSERLIAAAIARSGLEWRYRLGEWWVGLAAFVDFDVLGTRYGVRRGELLTTIFEPWRARPGAALSLTW